MENNYKIKHDFGGSYLANWISPLSILGMHIAAAIGYYIYKSIWMAMVTGFLGWVYVAYKLIEKYEFFNIID